MGKKLLTTMLIMLISLGLVSCNGETKTNTVPKIEVVQGDKQEDDLEGLSEKDSNKDENSEALDVNEVMKNIYLYGEKISLPCKAKELGSEYTLELGVPFGLDTPHSYYSLNYNGQEIGGVVLKDCEVGEETDEKLIAILILENTWGANIDLNIGGISFDSMQHEIVEEFGAPSQRGDDYITYGQVNKNQIEFSLFSKQDVVREIVFMHYDL